LSDVYHEKAEMSDFLAQITDWEMINLLVGTGMDSAKSTFGTLSSMVPGAAGHTVTLSHLGIPTIVLADGPAGVRTNQPHTAFPVTTLLACTWNEELAEEMGSAVGQEAISAGVDFWLAPALNIHRNPLCGRNFEYYSEDPVISGTIAAAVNRGVQLCGVGATCKHFIANNQETDRHGVDTIVDERTLREIYLKGFEIAVKSSNPWAIMTSYNALNGTLTAARKDLNVEVLRKEWGFEGIVMTDWEGEGVQSVEALKAGHNLLMPGYLKQISYIYTKIQDGTLLRSEIELCVSELLKMTMKTKSFARYYGIKDNGNGSYISPAKWFAVEK
jgi:beta-glucosidase